MAKRLLFLGVALIFVFGACNNEGDDEGGTFEMSLAGDAEVCDGDTCGGDGSGSATVEINSDQNELCYDITLEGVKGPNAAHIHTGDEGESGDVVVDLAYEGDDSGTGGETCIDDVDEGVLEEISEEPKGHYLNVHTEELPDGAVRAQLES
jgi:hypothetical protein